MTIVAVVGREGLVLDGVTAVLGQLGHDARAIAAHGHEDVVSWWDVQGPSVAEYQRLSRCEAALCLVDNLTDLGLVARVAPALGSAGPIMVVVPDTAIEIGSQAVGAGAASVASLGCRADQLDAMLTSMCAGLATVPTQVARSMADPHAWTPTDDELRWLQQLAAGATVGQVARKAGFADRSMYRRLRRLYRALGAHDKTSSLLVARQRGIV